MMFTKPRQGLCSWHRSSRWMPGLWIPKRKYPGEEQSSRLYFPHTHHLFLVAWLCLNPCFRREIVLYHLWFCEKTLDLFYLFIYFRKTKSPAVCQALLNSLTYPLGGRREPRVFIENFGGKLTATLILSEGMGLGPSYVPSWLCVASRKMTPEDVQSLIPHPQNRWACSLTWQKGITVAGRVKVGHELTLRWRWAWIIQMRSV